MLFDISIAAGLTNVENAGPLLLVVSTTGFPNLHLPTINVF